MAMDAKLVEKRKRRSRKRPYSSISYTTGNIGLNINRFNKAMGTSGLDVASPLGDIEGNTAGGECDCGGLGESLTEAKRYVRRYYIRPQNIFCSNKAEILKALIELEDANCSVYTLNNLGDEKDVSKLMNSDIIYYYDNGILYDKNKVKVMDYDLSIKKEENRKHFANVDKASEKDFKNAYEDRMTDVTELEEAIDRKMLPFNFEEFQKALADATRKNSVIDLGNSNPINEDACSYEWEVYTTKDNQIAVTGWGYNVYTEEDGIEDSEYFNTEEEAYEYIEGIIQADPYAELSLQVRTDAAFNLDFDDYNVYGEKLTEAADVRCCICGERIDGYGNNPDPYRAAEDGPCCDACNWKFVIPMRQDMWEEDKSW